MSADDLRMIQELMDRLALYRSRSRDWWAVNNAEMCRHDLIEVEATARALINMISCEEDF